jgi:putative aminopeptidase FrvX
MINMPASRNSQLKLLERLCNACAVSGDEGEVRNIVLEEIKGYTDEIKVDALGNVLATKRAVSASTPSKRGQKPIKVMLSAHMDEVGFMLVADDNEGLYRFEPVGGMDLRHLPGKAVLVGREHVPGVIGTRPVHLTTPEERKRTVQLDALRIDVGPGETKVELGDRAAYATRFRRNGPALISKALDNRLGVAMLIELVRDPPPHIDLLAAFTVQEEIGLSGARVAAYAFQPDLAIAVDSTPANDLPRWDGLENETYNTKLGLGPAIYIADSSTFSDPRLVRWLARSGEEAKIPYQFRQPGGGGTDAGGIHKSRTGVPSISVSVPHRYSHTAASIALFEDWKNTLALLKAALNHLAHDLLAGERR